MHMYMQYISMHMQCMRTYHMARVKTFANLAVFVKNIVYLEFFVLCCSSTQNFTLWYNKHASQTSKATDTHSYELKDIR